MATMSMATSVSETCIFLASTLISSALTAFSVVIGSFPWLSFVTGVEPAFHEDRITRHTEAEQPEDQRGKDEAGVGRLRGRPVGVGEVLFDDPEQVEHRDD